MKAKGFYVSPRIMIDFCDTISRLQLFDNRIMGSTSIGNFIILIIYKKSQRQSITELMELDCTYTKELEFAKILGYRKEELNFSR